MLITRVQGYKFGACLEIEVIHITDRAHMQGLRSCAGALVLFSRFDKFFRIFCGEAFIALVLPVPVAFCAKASPLRSVVSVHIPTAR